MMYISAFFIGLFLSLFFIGPVFFLLIETAITKNIKTAIILSLGIIFSDLLCIIFSYFGSKDILLRLINHPNFFYLYFIGALFFILYGIYMFLKRIKNINFSGNLSNNYAKVFFNGFMFNILNIGVIIFWFFIVSSLVIKINNTINFMVYISIILSTCFILDIFKILLARNLKKNISDKNIVFLRRSIAVFLVIFGLILGLKGLGYFKRLDKKIKDNIINTN